MLSRTELPRAVLQGGDIPYLRTQMTLGEAGDYLVNELVSHAERADWR